MSNLNLTPTDYLIKIINAKVYGASKITDLDLAKNLSKKFQNTILLKREDQQPVFSFKIRGAFNKMANLTSEQLKNGVICSSAGNHAQGVALSAKKLNCRAVIVMPTTSPQVKVDAVRSFGGEVELFGDSYSESYQRAIERQHKENLIFIHPFDDPDIIAGQGTIAMEILNQTENLDAIFIAIGGGGLISGVASYIKAVRPQIKIIGVQTNDSDSMFQSIKQNEVVSLEEVGLFSDGTAVKQVGDETFRISKNLIDDFVHINTDEICSAIKDIYIDTRSVVEPSGALGLAGVKKYIKQNKIQNQTFATIISGANMNFERLGFVAERTKIGEETEALFAITIPEKQGSFKEFCKIIDNLPGGSRNITEFNYRISNTKEAHIFVGLTINKKNESSSIIEFFQKNNLPALDLTFDNLAQEHLRYMIGGISYLSQNERLFRFTFPERQGALFKFLDLLDSSWNISLFNYHNYGADYSQVLVGIQVLEQDNLKFIKFLNYLNYPWKEETHNPAYKLFLV